MGVSERLLGIVVLTAALSAGTVFCAVSWPDRWPVAIFWGLLVTAGLVWVWIIVKD